MHTNQIMVSASFCDIMNMIFEFDVINMIDITFWMSNFLQTLKKIFVNHIWFVGLQDSYSSCEA